MAVRRIFTKISISVYLCFWLFFRKPEKLGSHTGSKWWPGDPDVKDDPLTRWPNDPVPCLGKTIGLHLRDLCWSFCRYQNWVPRRAATGSAARMAADLSNDKYSFVGVIKPTTWTGILHCEPKSQVILHLQIYCGFRHLLFNHRWSVRNIVEAFYNTCYPCCKL